MKSMAFKHFAAVASTLAATLAAGNALAYTVSNQGTAAYTNGCWPSTAQNGIIFGGLAIEEHQAFWPTKFQTSPFWYEEGSWPNGYNGARQYDNGFAPNISADITPQLDSFASYIVAEVHQGGVGVATMWGRVGTINSSAGNVGWQGPIEYSNNIGLGYWPAIAEAHAMTDQSLAFVEVHNGADSQGNPLPNLYASVATLGNNALSFDTAHGINGSEQGWVPSVAMMWDSNTNSYFVASAHQSNPPGQMSQLWIDYGTLQPGATSVQWLGAMFYDNGELPSIAICTYNGIGASNGAAAVFEVHNGGDGTIWYHMLTINSNHTLSNSGGSGEYYNASSGKVNAAPKVSCSSTLGTIVYEINDDGAGHGTLVRSKFGIN
jgi:hypothetical protein